MGTRKTRRNSAPVAELCVLAESHKWDIGRTTKRQKTQLTHPKTGSVIYLPVELGGRDITNFRRLILRGAVTKL